MRVGSRSEDVLHERERWLDRRRELYASLVSEAQAVTMLAELVAAGHGLDLGDWFARYERVFGVAAEIRLVRGTRLASTPSANIG